LYSDETLMRLKRIEIMKKDKYTLEEIKASLLSWTKVTHNELVTDKLTSIQVHLQQLQREVQEIRPIIDKMKPAQMKKMNKVLTPHTVACIEALLLLLGKSPLS
jgi:MerR family copper efflux transcriptional regulator